MGLDLWVRLWRVVPVPYRRNRGGVMREGVRWEPEAHFVPYAKSGRADWPEGDQWFRTKADAKAEAATRAPAAERIRDASGIAPALANDPEPPRRV